MAKDTTFNRWYDRHKEEYNEARRKRYQEDKEYRERMQTSSRESNRAKRQDRKVITVSPSLVPLKEVAKIIDRAPACLYRLEEIGVIPETLKIEGVRYFNRRQISLIQDYLEARGKTRTVLDPARVREVKLKIQEEWDA